ncbi:MAG: hypothetical protein IT515_19185 [Burkholderiales bacterium]|nr:hypothetical protein [Burkholderiales bacterium]
MRLLRDIAYVRSGDKGDTVTIGVIARTPGDYQSIVESIDEQAVRDLFGDWVKGRVDIYRMDNIDAVVVVLNQGLGGGATRTLRLDQTGKSLGNAILRLPVRIAV